MSLLALFLRFFRIGAFTIGGGVVMIGVIEAELRATKLLSDNEIADMTTSDDDADKDREVEQMVLSYLQRHPRGADTLDGIVRWWLPQQRYSVAQARIEAALSRLLSQGLIRQRRLPTGDALYVRGETTAVADDADQNEQR